MTFEIDNANDSGTINGTVMVVATTAMTVLQKAVALSKGEVFL